MPRTTIGETSALAGSPTPGGDALLADYRWLIGEEAARWLGEIAQGDRPLHSWATTLRRSLSPQRTHLVLELAELRERAENKFRAAERMFFTRIGLEQATDQWVSAYKATRFAECGRIADLCCGIGGDLLGLAAVGSVGGVDSDPVATLFAGENAQAVYGSQFSESVQIDTADVERLELVDVDAFHIDPDRRPSGRRTTSLDYCRPDIRTIERLLQYVRNAGIKLAPAARVPDDWHERCELEWISRGRECRQLVAWHGGLATHPGQRRATTLVSCDLDGCSVVRTFVGRPRPRPRSTGTVDRYLFEPDAAVLAAGLTSALASKYDLAAVGAEVAYLTGPEQVDDGLLAAFSVRDVLPYQLKSLRQRLRADRIGQLEVKKRGVRIDPRVLRERLQLAGENHATLIVTRLAGRTVAILADRVGRNDI